MFEWTRPVPPEWQTNLDQLAPGENVTRPMLSWLSGMPYGPVQRWVIHEVVPGKIVGQILEDEDRQGIENSLTRGLWEALKGPDPRTLGKWVPDKEVGKRWRSQSLVSRNQWDLHRQTGGLPMLSWIIEGDHGGHSWQFGPFEQGFLLAANVDPALVQAMGEAWPNPGSQPYADYDQRVLHALAERDLLRSWRQSLAWEDRTQRSQAGLILAGETASRRQDMLARVMRWVDGQIGEAVSDIPRRMMPDWSDFAGEESLYTDEDTLHQSLTETD
jgi:hypothetical protein